MKQISSREKTLFWTALALGILAASYMGVLRPVARDLRRLKAKAAITALDLQRMESTLARKAAIESAYAEVKNRITTSRSSQSEIIDMLMTVEKAAEAGGIEILENEHLKDEPFEHFNLHTVHFRGQGKPEHALKMLHQLQDQKLFLRIPHMVLTMKNHLLEMDLEITRVVCQESAE